MGLIGFKFIKTKVKDFKIITDVIDQTNFRLSGDDDATSYAGYFISGRITIVNKPNKDVILICNIRTFVPFPFFKRLFRFAMYRSLKKAGYIGRKPRFMFFSDLSKVLEGIL